MSEAEDEIQYEQSIVISDIKEEEQDKWEARAE